MQVVLAAVLSLLHDQSPGSPVNKVFRVELLPRSRPRQKGHVARAIAGQARPQGLSRSTGLVWDNEGEINVLNTSRYGVVNVPNFLTVEQKIA
jgi:hypothetical protein